MNAASELLFLNHRSLCAGAREGRGFWVDLLDAEGKGKRLRERGWWGGWGVGEKGFKGRGSGGRGGFLPVGGKGRGEEGEEWRCGVGWMEAKVFFSFFLFSFLFGWGGGLVSS